MLDLFYFAGDRVDYVIVHNPAKVRTNLFRKSNIEAELKKFGAREITLPVVTSITLLAIKRAERSGAQIELCRSGDAGNRPSGTDLAGEMQWAMDGNLARKSFQLNDAVDGGAVAGGGQRAVKHYRQPEMVGTTSGPIPAAHQVMLDKISSTTCKAWT